MHQTLSNAKRVKGIRAGFTLVELLVVVAIIGLLVGLTIPAVFAALGVFNRAACKFEVNALSDAVEKYRSKYGDYPPDGSSWPIMEAHLRKAFPNILVSELNLLSPANIATYGYIHNDYAGRVMDPAEALVFFLGGFSSDAQRPFTGPGGPFVLNGTTYQYNGSRQNSFYDFPAARLTVSASLVSTDESAYDVAGTPDLMPVFLSYKNKLEFGNPYVYFDSRTYQSKTTPLVFNFHQTRVSSGEGVARPYLSDQVNTLSPAANKPKLYENKQTFQILSPGLDGQYAGMLPPQQPVPPAVLLLVTSKGVVCNYDSTSLGFVPLATNILPPFVLDNSQMKLRPMADNVGNFTESNTLGENK